MDIYTKKTCPFCKTLNLVWLGDWGRDTGYNPETCECNCGKCFLLSDEHDQKEDLLEIICKHFDCEEYNFSESELAARLLAGETIAFEERKMDLSEFLKVNSDTTKGEELPKRI